MVPMAFTRCAFCASEDHCPHTTQGEVSESILRKINQTGGVLSQGDLDDYKVIVQPALQGTYRGRKIYTTHAPTSGPGRL